MNEQYFSHAVAHDVHTEITNGLDLLATVKHPIATIYGSHRVNEEDYALCIEVSRLLTQIGFAICSGGGSGIMEAANTTARKAGVPSIGLRGDAFKEEHVDADIYTHEITFHFVFVRRFMLCLKSRALLFFPGGYGTLNELMEILCLMQSNIIERVPIILMKKPFWQGMYDWFGELEASDKIRPEDLALISFADTPEDVKRILIEHVGSQS